MPDLPLRARVSLDQALTSQVTLQRSEDVLFQEVGGEAVLLDLASEQYFGLNVVGARIWDLLDGHSRLDRILAQLCEEFDAEPARIETDLLALAAQLAEAGLVKIRD